MAELPANWNLTTQKRADGKLDIMGKTDAGESYRVRTTDGPEVTDTDVSELRDADRENYPDRTKGAWEFTNKIIAHGKQREQDRENAFYDDLTEAAMPVVHAGFERKGSTVGSTRAYRTGWDRLFGKEN